MQMILSASRDSPKFNGAIAAVAFSGKGGAELFPPTLQELPSMPLRVEGEDYNLGRVRGARGSQVTLAMSL
jgi:hypothetical protein